MLDHDMSVMDQLDKEDPSGILPSSLPSKQQLAANAEFLSKS